MKNPPEIKYVVKRKHGVEHYYIGSDKSIISRSRRTLNEIISWTPGVNILFGVYRTYQANKNYKVYGNCYHELYDGWTNIYSDPIIPFAKLLITNSIWIHLLLGCQPDMSKHDKRIEHEINHCIQSIDDQKSKHNPNGISKHQNLENSLGDNTEIGVEYFP